MPRGFFPAGISPTTRSTAVSITLIVPDFSFVTYANGCATAAAARRALKRRKTSRTMERPARRETRGETSALQTEVELELLARREVEQRAARLVHRRA